MTTTTTSRARHYAECLCFNSYCLICTFLPILSHLISLQSVYRFTPGEMKLPVQGRMGRDRSMNSDDQNPVFHSISVPLPWSLKLFSPYPSLSPFKPSRSPALACWDVSKTSSPTFSHPFSQETFKCVVCVMSGADLSVQITHTSVVSALRGLMDSAALTHDLGVMEYRERWVHVENLFYLREGVGFREETWEKGQERWTENGRRFVWRQKREGLRNGRMRVNS